MSELPHEDTLSSENPAINQITKIKRPVLFVCVPLLLLGIAFKQPILAKGSVILMGVIWVWRTNKIGKVSKTILSILGFLIFFLNMGSVSKPPSVIETKSTVLSSPELPIADASIKVGLDKEEVDVLLRDVESLAAELETILNKVQDGSPITAETLGRIQIWKGNLRNLRNGIVDEQVSSFSASEQLLLALHHMKYAWESFEKGQLSPHANSIKLMRECLVEAKSYMKEGKY